jgi:CubicO group peptidase (beta-lactamase class C family)
MLATATLLAIRVALSPADTGMTRALAYIEAAVGEYMVEEQTPGLAIAIVDRDSLLVVRTFGFADRDTRVPVTASTRFLAGSISKTFTAIALLQLEEEGLVDLQRPIQDYLPWFRVRSPGGPVTLHQLLTHTAGLPRDRNDLPSSPYTALALRDRALPAAPGKHFAYSNIGYQLLSLVIEEVEGRGFAESIQSRLLTPLGLHATAPSVSQEGRLVSATGYQWLYDDRPPYPGEPLVPVAWTEYSAGDANIVTSAPDLAVLLKALLRQGAGPRGRLLQARSFSRMVQRTVPAPELGEAQYYGYGLVLGARNDDPIFWHTGGMPGFGAVMLGDMDAGIGVVILVNGPGNPRRLAEYAIDALIAARRGHTPPPVPVQATLDSVPDAEAYAGRYLDSSGVWLDVDATGGRLKLITAAGASVLYRDGPDSFVSTDTAFARFPLHFGRRGGEVVELVHGARWFARPGISAARADRSPAAWHAYVGHYRAQVPYFSNYRVIERQGELLLVSPEGIEELLVPLKGTRFRVGRDPYSVEQVEFLDVVSGRALRLDLSGTDYYRSTAP